MKGFLKIVGISAVVLVLLAAAALGYFYFVGAADADTKAAETGSLTAGDSFVSFSNIGLDGDTYTNDIFSQYDITMVNFWGTFCAPCLDEMPDIAELNAELPENARVVFVLRDVDSLASDTGKLAQKQIVQTGTKDMLHLMSSDFSFYKTVGKELEFLPSTVFVNREGVVVGEFVVGPRSKEQYKELIMNLL